VIFGGDFRQSLSVISKGTTQEVVHSMINSSYLWNFCEVLTLTKNTRLLKGASDSDAEARKMFSDLVLNIGDGNIGESNDVDISLAIPDDFLI